MNRASAAIGPGGEVSNEREASAKDMQGELAPAGLGTSSTGGTGSGRPSVARACSQLLL